MILRHIIFLGCLALLMAGCGFGHAPRLIGTADSGLLEPDSRIGPYCGPYCMYGSMRLLGSEVEAANLIKAEYFNAQKGSNLSDLKRMAKDNGFHTLSLSNLNWDSLRSLPPPVILHLDRGRYKNYDHYVVYAGTSGGKPLIYDPPNALRGVPLADLLVDWDGIGVVVAKEPVANYTVYFWYWARLCAMFCVLLLAVAVLGKSVLTHPPVSIARTNVLREFLFIGGIALSATFIFHMYAPVGFYANQPALNKVYVDSLKSLLPKVDAERVERLMQDPGVVVVDARWRVDFDKGHLPAATSVEPDANLERVRESTGTFGKQARFIVYCQSSSCDYALRVAQLLQLAGYHNILYFKEGWLGWLEHEAMKPKASL